MKKKILTLFLALILFTPIIEAKADAVKEATHLYNKAIDLYSENNIDKSVELFKKAIELNPDFYEAYYNLTQILMSQDRDVEAIALLEKIVALKPDDTESLYNLGKIQYKRGYLSSAHKYLIQIKPDAPQYESAKILITRIENRQSELNIETKLKEHKSNVDSLGRIMGVQITDFQAPSGLTSDNSGNIYIASFSQNYIYKITPQGKKTAFSKSTLIKGPIGLASDKNDNIYIANYLANNILKITPQGVATVFATIQKPYCIMYDENKNRLYVTEQSTNKLFKFDLLN